MISEPVKQNNFIDIKDYNVFWESAVSGFVEEIFKTPEDFKNSYENQFENTVRRVSYRMKIIPIDIKFIIQRFYEAMMKETKDNESPDS